jgi:copper chaperone CopZ
MAGGQPGNPGYSSMSFKPQSTHSHMKKLILLTALIGFTAAAGAEEIKLAIEGMSCPEGCVKSVKDALTEVKGVKEAKVELGKAEVNYDAKLTSAKDLIAAVEKAGFKVKQ